MGIPDYLTCLLRKLYTGQEATVRTGHGTTDWFQIGKGVQGCILSPYLFNFYAEYIMRKAGLEEAQAGIKIARRNINNLRYTDDTTLMAESEEELKSLLINIRLKQVNKYFLLFSTVRLWTVLVSNQDRICSLTRVPNLPQLLFAFLLASYRVIIYWYLKNIFALYIVLMRVIWTHNGMLTKDP